MRNIGFHLSIAGGVYKAYEDVRALNIDAFPIFLKSSNRWEDKPYQRKDLDKFHAAKSVHKDVKVFAHSAYLAIQVQESVANKSEGEAKKTKLSLIVNEACLQFCDP